MGAFNSPKDWGPLLTAMVTPFKADGSVDYPEAERLANYLVDEQKNTGIVVAGTTGESPTLTDDEKLELLRVVISAVGQKVAVVFGAGTYDTNHSIHLTEKATSMGALGIMLVSPYYNKPPQEALYQHFKTISQRTDLPVLIYNIAGRTSVNIETSTLVRLAEDVKNICAVKEASGNLAQVADVCANVPDGFRVYSGDDILTLPILSCGGVGVVSVVGHVAGKQIFEMIETFFKNPVESAKQARKLNHLFKSMFITTNPIPIKYAVSLLGFKTGTYRLPMIPPNDNEKKIIEDAMRKTGILEAKAAVSPG